jgi:threonine/homoserine/homoserine lactone efflux protein
MPDISVLAAFTAAAFVLAVMPGPGLFYILGRTLASGGADGYASVLGTALGGFVHVVAGTLGASAIVMTSAAAFTGLKLVGGLYLVYLGIVTWRAARSGIALQATPIAGSRRAFRDGVVVEATNPKTAAFFLALIPQFIDVGQGSIASQFLVLGTVAVALNTASALAVVMGAARLRARLLDRPHIVRRIRQGSGAVLAGLGVSLLLARRPA